MTAVFVAYDPLAEGPLDERKVLLCERLNGIGQIRGYVINGNWFATFDREGWGKNHGAMGTKIVWSGKKPDHIKGYVNFLNWFEKEILPGLTPSAQARRPQ